MSQLQIEHENYDKKWRKSSSQVATESCLRRSTNELHGSVAALCKSGKYEISFSRALLLCSFSCLLPFTSPAATWRSFKSTLVKRKRRTEKEKEKRSNAINQKSAAQRFLLTLSTWKWNIFSLFKSFFLLFVNSEAWAVLHVCTKPREREREKKRVFFSQNRMFA